MKPSKYDGGKPYCPKCYKAYKEAKEQRQQETPQNSALEKINLNIQKLVNKIKDLELDIETLKQFQDPDKFEEQKALIKSPLEIVNKQTEPEDDDVIDINKYF